MAESDNRKPTTSRDVKSIVETANAEDENAKTKGSAAESNDDTEEDDDAEDEAGEDESDDEAEDESDDEDDAEGDDEDEDESDESKSSDKKSTKFRYSQFAGDGSEKSYRKNIEKAYTESSAEGIRLNQELQAASRRVDNIVRAAANDPEFATKLQGLLDGDGTATARPAATGINDNPFLKSAEAEWKSKSEQEAKAFVEANPEVVSDPKLNAEVREEMEIISEIEYRKTGRLVGAGEAMTKAYRNLGLEDKTKKSERMSETKKLVAPTRPQGSRKKARTTSDFTDSQLAFADVMGVSKEKLAKFAK